MFVKLPIKLLKYFLFFALSLFGCVTPSRDSAISCDILKKPRDILKVEDLYQSSVVGKFYVSALSRRSENLFFLSNLSEVVGSKPEKNNRFLKIQGRPIGIASFGMKDYLASFSDSESKITLFGLGQEKTVKVISVGTKAIPISAIGKYVLFQSDSDASGDYGSYAIAAMSANSRNPSLKYLFKGIGHVFLGSLGRAIFMYDNHEGQSFLYYKPVNKGIKRLKLRKFSSRFMATAAGAVVNGIVYFAYAVGDSFAGNSAIYVESYSIKAEGKAQMLSRAMIPLRDQDAESLLFRTWGGDLFLGGAFWDGNIGRLKFWSLGSRRWRSSPFSVPLSSGSFIDTKPVRDWFNGIIVGQRVGPFHRFKVCFRQTE